MGSVSDRINRIIPRPAAAAKSQMRGFPGHGFEDRQPEFVECDPGDIAREVADFVREKAASRNVRVETVLAKNAGTAMIDRNGIFRCLMNLAANAVDACAAEGGEVRIETIRSSLKPVIRFRVSDNGQGISDENRQKLFREFFSTKGSQGTGLGDQRHLQDHQEHGGAIWCDSELSKGSTFTIELGMTTQRHFPSRDTDISL